MLSLTNTLEMMPSSKNVVSYFPNKIAPPPFCFVLNVSELVGAEALEM